MSFTQNLQNISVAEDKWIQGLIARINALEGDACAELNQVKEDAFDYIQKKLAALQGGAGNSQLVALVKKILKAIANGLSSLQDVINIVTDLVTLTVQPYVTAIETNIAQISAIVGEISQLTSAIAGAASRLESCAVSFPSVPVSVPAPFSLT